MIIGSTSTYGKGTVQRDIALDRTMGFEDPSSSLGSVKITLQKYYRINGGSTQLRGVASDVVLPDIYEYYKIREKDNPDALPWDEIGKLDYTTWKYAYDVDQLKNYNNNRMKTDTAFSRIHANAEWLAKLNDKVYPLNYDRYQVEQKEIRAAVKQTEALSKLPAEMDVETLPQDSTRYAGDSDKAVRYRQWAKGLRTDRYLNEAVNVLDDMVKDKNLVYSK